jgi:hypothetical protein
MKEFFDGFKSVTDIFNAGRLIFYPFAGALVVIPFYLLARIILVSPTAVLFTQLTNDLKSIDHSPLSLAIFAVAAVVVGFLIAVTGFTVLDEQSAEISKQIAALNPDRSASFNYNYPLLRQKKDEDYATWLISEYFRYVEIATYIPIGGMVGLTLMMLYVLVFLMRHFAEAALLGVTSAHVVFILLLISVIITKWYLWPEIWVKRVIVPTLCTFLKAKGNLIEGVKAVERAVGPFKAEDSVNVAKGDTK